MNKPLEIEVTYQGNIARVKLRGRLDTPGVDRIEAKFTSAVVPEGRNTVVDLSEISFIASMGLRMFIGLGQGAQAQQREAGAVRAAIASQRGVQHRRYA